MKRLMRHFGLTLLALLLFVPMAVRAQDAPSKPEPSKPQSAAQEPENPNAAAGRELTEASKAAAGEPVEKEDQETGLKHSVAVRWIARTTGMSVETAYWIAMVINFAIIAVVIVAFMKSKLPGYFRIRNEQIQRGIQEARAASDDAKRRLADIEVRLSRLDSEVAAIKASADTESQAEEARIRATAEADVKRVLESAEQEIESAARQARRDLKSLAAGLAVDLAAAKLKVDASTDEGLVRNFVAQLGKDGR